MKVFVTGADGFIGSHLVERLIKLGHKVKAFTFYNFRGSNGWLDSIDKNLLKDLHIISGDIRDYGFLEKQTKDVDEIWSQVFPHLQNLFESGKKYKKCGVIFHNLIPDTQTQTTLFTEEIKIVQPPVSLTNKWEMRQDFKTQHYTTSWEEIPEVFV